ncbi:C2 family cysteine protease [Cellulosimicrobium sp. SH8]|uniref:C2 family cysteine protease n=1 Tax=Cellulosimicrobium sp. SH8 TaxID=2952936 RepID=UPI0021F3BC9B|nr:C2 family cysteine protease [Cellulosimicrobium sp. SH8]
MSGMYGADVAQLRQLGQRLSEAADRLTSLRGELDALVTSSPWEGPDGDALRGEWSTSHAPAVAAVGAVLGDAATAVVRQADQQESASTDGAGGSGGGGSGGGSGGGGGDRGTPGEDGDRPGDPDLTDDLGDYEDVPPIDLENEDFSIDDINQGQVGDCWFLAGLGAVATTDPEFLREHIRLNDDGTYTVTMYKDGEPVEIVVEPTVPENGVGGQNGEPNWVSIYEKAAAEYFGGDYEDIDGGHSDDAFEAITGRPAERSGELSLSDIQDRLKDGPVAVGTEDDDAFWWWEDEVDDSRIVPNHAYVVTEVKEVDGEMRIHVVNPWGPGGGMLDGEQKVGDLWLTEQEYKENFDSVYSGG